MGLPRPAPAPAGNFWSSPPPGAGVSLPASSLPPLIRGMMMAVLGGLTIIIGALMPMALVGLGPTPGPPRAGAMQELAPAPRTPHRGHTPVQVGVNWECGACGRSCKTVQGLCWRTCPGRSPVLADAHSTHVLWCLGAVYMCTRCAGWPTGVRTALLMAECRGRCKGA